MEFKEGFVDKIVVPAGAKDVLVFDDELPGFGVRKFATGGASYFVKYSVGTQQRRKTLGKVVKGNLKPMRVEASIVLAKARLGTDVVGEAKAAAAAQSAVVTLGDLVPKYLEQREADMRGKSHIETTRYLAGSTTKDQDGNVKELTPSPFKPLHKLAVDAVTRRDIKTILDGMEHKTAADRARAALSGLFTWAIECDYRDDNPTLGISPRSDNVGRTRTLSEPELAQVWNACGNDDFGCIVKLLILTGQRKTEIGDLRWSEIDMDERLIKLSPARCKNGKSMIKRKIAFHVVPLSAEAIAIIEAVPRGTSDFVFGRFGTGFKGFALAKKALDTRIAAGAGKPLAQWVVHEIRHAVTTHLVESRRDAPGEKPYSFCAPHIAEAITNHLSGHKAGIGGKYNHATYLEEKREALDLWGARLVARPEPARSAKAKQAVANGAGLVA